MICGSAASNVLTAERRMKTICLVWPQADTLRRSAKRWLLAYKLVRYFQIAIALAIAIAGAIIALGGQTVQASVAVFIAIAFGANIVAELSLWSLRLSARSEARRLAADVIDSEGWQFCLHIPSAYNTDDEVAALNLKDNVRARIKGLSPDLPADALDPLEPNAAVTTLRAALLEERHQRYVSERVRVVAHLSATRAKGSEIRLDLARLLVLLLMFGGLVVSIVRAAGSMSVNLVGLFIAAAGAATAWLQFGDFAAIQSDAKADNAFFLDAAAQAERFTKDNNAWYDVVGRIEARVAPTGLS
jgi:hypothetical protein